MSPPPHREKDAKVEGRDPPENAKGTMETFRALTRRLLGVPLEEIRAQQKLYDASKLHGQSANSKPGKAKRYGIIQLKSASEEKALGQKQKPPRE